MKILTVLLSVVVVIILTVNLLQAEQVDAKTKQQVSLKAIIIPVPVTGESLALETRWLDLKAKRENKNKPVEALSSDKTTNNMFNIGNNAYRLYGIFYQQNTPFILLKGDNDAMQKLTLGQILNQFTLIDVKSNRITFERDEQSIEFNLFEPKNDDKTKQ